MSSGEPVLSVVVHVRQPKISKLVGGLYIKIRISSSREGIVAEKCIGMCCGILP